MSTKEETWKALSEPLPVIDLNGSKFWYDNEGRLHREHGPAVINYVGTLMYWIHGKLHREDGPAVIWPNTDCEYWLYNVILSKEEWDRRLSK